MKRQSVLSIQYVQCVFNVHSYYMLCDLDIEYQNEMYFIDWFNVGIQYVDIEYVLHHV